MNEVMSPRVGLIECDVDGWPLMPQDAQITAPDGSTPLVPVWRGAASLGTIGSFPSREYRDIAVDQLCVVVRLGNGVLAGKNVCLAIAWVPSASRLADNPTFDALIAGPTMTPHVLGLWPVVADANGNLTVPALDADASAAGVLARSLWPAGWRILLPTDPQGSMGVPPGPPTGPRRIAESVA